MGHRLARFALLAQSLSPAENLLIAGHWRFSGLCPDHGRIGELISERPDF
jgi:hypothetical protein